MEAPPWPHESRSRCKGGSDALRACRFSNVVYSKDEELFYYFSPLELERRSWQPNPTVPVQIKLGLFYLGSNPTIKMMFVGEPVAVDPSLVCDITRPVYLHAPFTPSSFGHTLRDNFVGIANNIQDLGTAGADYRLLLYDEDEAADGDPRQLPGLWGKYGALVARDVATWRRQLSECERPFVRFHDLIAGYDERTVPLPMRVLGACGPEYFIVFRDHAYRTMDLAPPLPVARQPTFNVVVLDKPADDVRRIVNADELQRSLAAGFPGARVRALPLLALPLREQLETMAVTSVFISTAGSASFRLMFLPTGAHVIVIGPLEDSPFSPELKWIELEHCWEELRFITMHRYRIYDARHSIPNDERPPRGTGTVAAMFRWWDADKYVELDRMGELLNEALHAIHALRSVAISHGVPGES